ncbi:MAG TPA: TonB-dependent receptor [Caulobacteraceae bacterium]
MPTKFAMRLLAGTALSALFASGVFAAEARPYDIPQGDAALSLQAFAMQSGLQVLFPYEAVKGKTAPAIKGDYSDQDALAMLAASAGLRVTADDGKTITLRAAGPQSGSAAGGGAEVEALIVTAQKREEDIQDVPIAISAFSAKDLEAQKIEGGFDLLKAIPNVTFSKNNFTSYNFSIRGIGTKAVSATTDPAVAVAFNSSPMIVNRLFEQEYFDIERVEVLRGPQGTLYGRNATSGVINVISAKPDLNDFKGWLKGEVGNYNTKRVSAMVNVPIVEDKLAIRFAGAATQRSGYGYNAVTDSDVDGRDLWSTRVTVGFEPTETLRGNLIWERFSEDDERARTSKQLCHTDPGVRTIGSVTGINDASSGILSQGCLPGSLYDDAAFRAPNGHSLPFVFPLRLDVGQRGIIDGYIDPYSGLEQSTDLREISSRYDPIYRAQADVVELNLEFDLTDDLTVVSQTLYNKDEIFSTQDYNRFNTRPVLNDTAEGCRFQYDFGASNGCPGGYFNDPQLGSSNTVILQDISQGTASQFSQEFRLQSNFDGPVNFNLGANYVRFQTDIDYYVFSNAFTLIALAQMQGVFGEEAAAESPAPNVIIDPNPLDSITGTGSNYFRSRNPYTLKSTSIFGELYWEFSDTMKLTAGLRYTDDKKNFEVWPTNLLNNEFVPYEQDGDIDQHWGEFTGRLGIDWKPVLPFTDQTMLYAFYSRGYKAGGANPPNMSRISIPGNTRVLRVPPTMLHADTFNPEFVNAFEVGTKNALMGGSLIFNATGFYYDYKDYQISQIIDRIALNENFDAKIWGLEFETIFSPTENLRFNANLGYLDTKVGKGEKSIDPMNRLNGHDDWVLMKNWAQYPSNCIIPAAFAENAIGFWREIANALSGGAAGPFTDATALQQFFDSACLGMWSPRNNGPAGTFLYDLSANYGEMFGYGPIRYDPFDPHGGDQWGVSTEEANFGAGFYTDLSGNELPNAPHWTVNVGAQYGFDFLEGWRGTVRADGYWQSQSWHRIYNLGTYDKLHGWYNANLSVWVENDDGLKIELYAKNIMDDDPITDAFLNSDDSGLTTNVFVLDPRLIGLSIRKEF